MTAKMPVGMSGGQLHFELRTTDFEFLSVSSATPFLGEKGLKDCISALLVLASSHASLLTSLEPTFNFIRAGLLPVLHFS